MATSPGSFISRIKQHERTIKDKKWDSSGVSFHVKTCKDGFDWENTSTLEIEDRRFDRKVREVLEIQFRETSPHNEHDLNQDDGQYVTTTFWKSMLSYLREKSLPVSYTHLTLPTILLV